MVCNKGFPHPVVSNSLDQILRNTSIVCERLFCVLWQAITSVAEWWVVVVRFNALARPSFW